MSLIPASESSPPLADENAQTHMAGEMAGWEMGVGVGGGGEGGPPLRVVTLVTALGC